jgi:hypothetical protein
LGSDPDPALRHLPEPRTGNRPALFCGAGEANIGRCAARGALIDCRAAVALMQAKGESSAVVAEIYCENVTVVIMMLHCSTSTAGCSGLVARKPVSVTASVKCGNSRLETRVATRGGGQARDGPVVHGKQ